jgi:hypothetical protein
MMPDPEELADVVPYFNSQFLNPHLSPAYVAKRRRRLWMQGLRPRPPEAYPWRYGEEGDRA